MTKQNINLHVKFKPKYRYIQYIKVYLYVPDDTGNNLLKNVGHKISTYSGNFLWIDKFEKEILVLF